MRTKRIVTTIETVTAEQCGRLAAEAAVAGDMKMHHLARDAADLLDDRGDAARSSDTVRNVVEAIRDAEAQS